MGNNWAAAPPKFLKTHLVWYNSNLQSFSPLKTSAGCQPAEVAMQMDVHKMLYAFYT